METVSKTSIAEIATEMYEEQFPFDKALHGRSYAMFRLRCMIICTCIMFAVAIWSFGLLGVEGGLVMFLLVVCCIVLVQWADNFVEIRILHRFFS